MKVLGILFGALILFFIIWIGSGVVWWQSNQEEVMQAVEQATQEGQAIGRDSTDVECLQTYLDIMRDCKEMTCSIQNQVFLKACLDSSEMTPAFCAGIPKQSDLMDLAKWATQKCVDSQVDNAHCAAGLQEVAVYCESAMPR